MRETAASRLHALLTLAGFAAFGIFGGARSLPLLPLALLALLSFLGRPPLPRFLACRRCLVPFASGLLLLPMRLFYWDRGDFSLRLRRLQLLAVLFALLLLAAERRWPRRFLLHFNSRSLRTRMLSLFVAVELLFILAAGMLTVRGVALAGDEPHYLAISQSLARDGDLNVFNQYFRGGFREFLDVEKLPAHGTWGKGFKKIYSYHLPGVSLTVVPFFFLKVPPPLLYFLLRSWLGLFGAMLAVLVYLFALRLWRSRSLALFTVAAFSLTAPVFFYSFHLFPEVQAMLLVLGALYILLFKAEARASRCLWAGLLLGSTIFWGVKYALFIYPLTLGFLVYWARRRRFRHALLLIVFPVFFQALFFLYLYRAYGTFSPNAVYYGMLNPEQSQALVDTLLRRIPLRARWETLLDYFFDQRDGLLLYNPLYFFAFPGLLLALKNFKRYRVHLLVALPAALFILNHAFSTIRAGYCPQGRYLAPAAWALMLFALVYYREGRHRLFRRGVLLLPLYSLFVTAYQVFEPFTLYQPTTHDSAQRAGLMFQNWSNSAIHLPSLLPSFIKADNQGHLPNVVFPAVVLLLAVLALVRRPARGRPWAAPLVFLSIFSLGSLFPDLGRAAPHRLPGPRDLSCRVHFVPRPLAEAGKAAWRFSGPRLRLRVESLVPLKEIEVRLENPSAAAPLLADVALFDVPAGRRELPPRGGGTVLLAQPRAKRIRALYGYQFEIRLRPVGTRLRPQWLLALALR